MINFLVGDKNPRMNSGLNPQNNLQRSNSMMGNDPTHFSSNQQSNESNMQQFPADAQQNMPFGPNNPSNNPKMPNFLDQKPDVTFYR